MSTFTRHCGKTKPHGPHSKKVPIRNGFGRTIGYDTYNCRGTRDLMKPRHR